MTDRGAAGDSETETHHEPHGAAAPHGAADDIRPHAAEAAADDDANPESSDHGAGHEGEALGPIDVPAWAAGILGVALGLVVIAGLVVATAPA